MTDTLATKMAVRAADPHAVLTGGTPDHSEGMSYLHSLPRRLVTLYLPLSIILLVLLFPFYWMALTSIKPDEQLLDLDTYSPFWTWNPTFKHIAKLLFETQYPTWLWNTMLVAVCATALSIIASVLAAYAIVRLRFKGAQWVGGAIFLAYLVPPSILFIPLSTVVYQYGLFDTPFALILTYPTISCSTWKRSVHSGPGTRRSSTSTSCCSKPIIRCGCGTRCLSRSAQPSFPSSPACWRPMPSFGCAIAARSGLAARSSWLIWCRRRSCSSRCRRWCSNTGCSTRRSRSSSPIRPS